MSQFLLRFARPASRAAAVFAISALLAWSAPPDRVREGNRARVVRLSGSVHTRLAAFTDLGALDPATRVTGLRLVLKPSGAQQSALEQLLEEQRDPASPNYQKWLTPEEYGEQFGVSASDLGALSSWLSAQGFTVDETARAANWISFTGTSDDIERAFRTEMHRYQSGSEFHFANASEVSIPEAFSDLIDSVHGMTDFRPRPPGRTTPRPQFDASNGAHYLAPDDLAAIYHIAALYTAGFDATGQKLAIIGQTDINLADIRGFRSQFGLPAHDPQLLLAGADPGVSPGDQVEADLDLEWSGAVARNASIVYVYSPNVFESLQYAIDQNVAPVISMSYGSCEIGSPTSYRTLAQQANAQGITWMNSSGDSGAAGCDYAASIATQGPAVTFPADIPEVTAVGGTEFNEGIVTGWASKNSATFASATGYLPEKAWNDTASGGGISASGGGASVSFRKPWWQSGVGVPNDNDRDVPDIALSASADHDGYLLYANGNLMAVGGTSASSPVFAGIVSILNQYLVAKGGIAKAGLGNINPNLYSLAQSANGIFHDITLGDNIVPCKAGTTGCTTGSFGYKAGAGYDLVTGLGSVDAFNLVTNWTSLPPATGTTMTLTSNPSSILTTASTQINALVKAVSGTAAPTGTVTLTDGGVTLGSATLVNGAASVTVKGASLSPGSNVLNGSFAPAGAFASATASVTVTVTVPLIGTTTTLTANPSSITTSGASQLTATVKAASGNTVPGGVVTFSAGNKTIGTATLSAAGAASVNVNATALSVGTNTVTAVYAGNSTFTGSTSTAVSVTVTAPAVATTTLVSANPTSIAQTGTTVLTATVKPAAGAGLPSGTVNFTLGKTVLGLGTLSLAAGVETATLTVKGTSLATGANTITATYSGATGFTTSAASLTVVVTTPPVTTTTSVSASPAAIAATGSTQITATVKPASGTTSPTGTIAFALGSTALGSSPLSTSGTATLAVKGTSLATGANLITASYAGATGFAASSGSVTVTATVTATVTLAVTASPSTIAQSASTQLAITAKTAGGPVASGTVTLTNGATTLGTAAISAGATTFSLPGSNLTVGTNTVTATYNGASASVQITVTPAVSSNVAVSAVKGSTQQIGFPVNLQVHEQAGVASTLTGLTINGTSFSQVIAAFFGTAQLAAHGTLTAQLVVQWAPMPATLTFIVSGVDANGHQWSQTTTLATH